MLKRLQYIAGSALLLAVLAGCSDRSVVYSTSEYTWKENTIEQNDGTGAVALTSDCIRSDYDGAEYESGEWKLSKDISRFASYKAPTLMEEAVYNMALEECEKAVEIDSTLRTGKEWSGVWTRDVSYSILLSMSHLQTKVSMNSLMRKVDALGRIIQDTGTGGSWPCSSDRMIWVAAAFEIYKVTGDEQWLETIYPIIRRSIEVDLLTVYNEETGMVKGESSYLDWREQEYPRWMKPADIYNSENLGTVCVFIRALDILAWMERYYGNDEDASRYEGIASGMREGVNKYFWMEDKGYYGQFIYGRQNLILSPRSETLGEALAILYGVATPEQSVSITANVPNEAFGTPCFYPQIKGIPPYHNDAMWPFVQAWWMKACAQAGNWMGVMHSIGTITRNAAMYLTNKENMVIHTGRWQGTEINSSNMLWSLSGNLSIVYSVLFGMQYETDGLHFTPFVPKAMKGERSLTGFPYRDALLDITLSGYGAAVKSFRMDGKDCDPFVPSDLKGHHVIEIELDGRMPDCEMVMVENAYTPDTPQCQIDGDVLRWTAVDGAAEYEILCNGERINTTDQLFFNLEQSGEYQVISVDGSGLASFASEPLEFFPSVKVVSLHGFGKISSAPYRDYPGKGYLHLTKTENVDVRIPVDIDDAGRYAVDFTYSNANGPVNTDNRCAIRTLWVDGKRVGTVVMPQVGQDCYDIWNQSNVLTVELEKGRHEFRLTYSSENDNMNIAVNSAAVTDLRLIRQE